MLPGKKVNFEPCNTRDVAALLEKDAAGQSELGTVTSCAQAEAIS